MAIFYLNTTLCVYIYIKIYVFLKGFFYGEAIKFIRALLQEVLKDNQLPIFLHSLPCY